MDRKRMTSGPPEESSFSASPDADAGQVSRERSSPRISYRTGLILSISGLVIATGLALSFLAFRGARNNTTSLANSLFEEVSKHAVTKTRGFVLCAVPLAEALGNLSNLGLATDQPNRLAQQLSAVLRANPGVSWVSYSDESGTFVGAYRTPDAKLRINQSHIASGGRTQMVEYDILPDGAWQLYRKDDDSGYDPRARPFYARAREARQLVWLPPYIFYEQGVPGITCAKPLYDADGRLHGVLTVDFDLNTLSQFVKQLTISPNSRLFIVTDEGILLAHPTQHLQVTQGQREKGKLLKVGEINDPLVKAFYAQLGPEDRVAPGGEDHARQFNFRHADVDYFARATAFSIDDGSVWVLGAVAPQADFLSAVQRSNDLSLLFSLIALCIAVAIAMYFARRVSGPIVTLANFMRGVGAGNLTQSVSLGGAAEFRQLSTAINQMLSDLRDRSRLRTALAVAMEVQQKLLPAAPPNVPGLDLAGSTIYCDETGGDYFDYLVLDEQHLLIAIGDVMGHGIGAALVMASARAILHSRATSTTRPGELLSHLNDLLVADMTGSRFMTMYLCRIDPAAGTLQWASAGHDPAIIFDPVTGHFDDCGRGGVPLGIEPHVEYKDATYTSLRPGHVLVFATDGVWETVNESGEFFGKERLQNAVRAAAAGPARDIVAMIHHELFLFRGNARQRDDVTVVIAKLTH